MSNNFLNALKSANNYTHTENCAITYKSTLDGLMDLFALGGSYRNRSEEDCIFLFKKAFDEDPVYALKCLFYLGDCRGGQGERRFFRTCAKWLASYDTEAMRRNLIHIPEYRRWDDLFIFIGTPLESDALGIVKHQLALDVQCKTPSLLGKWMPSENTSSKKTKATAKVVKSYLKMTSRQYRKTLSILRERINVLERLMSENRWDEIEFDKIPSKAGLRYKNAFARHDVERLKKNAEVQSYADFAKDATKTVNADTLYPYEVVNDACRIMRYLNMDDTERSMINKYWDNLKDYFNEKTFNGLAMVDTSASMRGLSASAPINVAISLGMYCAERAKGPFAGHYVSFSSRPQLISVDGIDFCDKVSRIWRTNLIDNTNIEAAFDMLLETAIKNECPQEDLPENLIVISDMEFDEATEYNTSKTLMEGIRDKWNNYGYKMPNLIFWNVDARQDNIPMKVEDGITFVSGFSPVLFEQIMTGKTAKDFVLDKLDSERYSVIR